MNLTTTLFNADSLEIDGTFIRHFNYYSKAENDDVMLEAAEEFQFTKEQVEAATFNEENNTWSIENDAGDSFDIEAFTVNSATPAEIALNQSLFCTTLKGKPASITVTPEIKDAIEGHFAETSTLYSNSNTIIIDVTELSTLDIDQPGDDDEQTRIELLASELAAFTNDSQKEMELMLKGINYLEIFS